MLSANRLQPNGHLHIFDLSRNTTLDVQISVDRCRGPVRCVPLHLYYEYVQRHWTGKICLASADISIIEASIKTVDGELSDAGTLSRARNHVITIKISPSPLLPQIFLRMETVVAGGVGLRRGGVLGVRFAR